MKKTLKIFLILISIPVVLFAVAAAVLASIDLNDYRGEIEQAVNESTGRQLSVKGDLKKSFFPWLGATVESVSLSNAEGFQPETFAAIEKLEIKIDTLSLIYLKPYISRVVVKGLNLNLARNAQGKTNWQDLSQPKATSGETVLKDDEQDSPGPDSETHEGTADAGTDVLASLKIAGLTVENANVHWVDQQAGADYALQSFNLDINEIALNKPLSLNSDFSLRSESPKLNVGVKIASPQTSWDLEAQRYGVTPLTVDVKASGEGVPVSPLTVQLSVAASADLKQQTLSISDMRLNTLGATVHTEAKVSQLIDAPNYQATVKLASVNPRDMMNALAIAVPEMSDNKALTALSVDMKISGQLDQVKITPLIVRLDQTTIKADTSVKNFSQPAISANIEIDVMNLDRYLPPVVESESGAEPPAPAKQQSEDTTGQPLPIPVVLIRGLNVLAQLDAKKITVRKIDIDNLHTKVRVKNGIASISPLSLKIAEGTVSSDIILDASRDTPRYQLTQAIKQVQAAPLAKAFAGDDYVSGNLVLDASVTSSGSFVKDITRNLNGNFSFNFKDGAVKGFNLGERLRESKAKFDKKEYVPSESPRQTDFAELSGSATIKDGIIHNKDLRAMSPLLRVDGKGQVNLPGESLDYLITTNLVGTSKGQGGKSVEELKGIPIPIRLTGPFSDIQWDYKWSEAIKGVKKELKKKAATKIKAKKEAVKQKLDTKKEKKVEEIKEKAKDKLKKLFKF